MIHPLMIGSEVRVLEREVSAGNSVTPSTTRPKSRCATSGRGWTNTPSASAQRMSPAHTSARDVMRRPSKPSTQPRKQQLGVERRRAPIVGGEPGGHARVPGGDVRDAEDLVEREGDHAAVHVSGRPFVRGAERAARFHTGPALEDIVDDLPVEAR